LLLLHTNGSTYQPGQWGTHELSGSEPASYDGGYLLACELKFLGKHQAEFIGAMNAQQVTRFGRLAVSAAACLISVSHWRIALHCIAFSSSLIVDSTHTLLFNTKTHVRLFG
jgi:hypothetical protein